MTDKKFADEEIIKALECCKNCCCKQCDEQPDFQEAIDLINRQKAENEALKMEFSVMRDKANSYKAENERLKAENTFAIAERNAFDTSFNKVLKQLKNAKAEAYKEFAERLKGYRNGNYIFVSTVLLDNLIKEMVGEEEANNNDSLLTNNKK